MYSSLLSRVTGMLLPLGLRSIVLATPNSAKESTKVSAPKNPEFSLTLVCDGEIKGEVFGISGVVLQEYEALV